MDVIGFKNKYDLPVVKSKCPVDGYTKRQYAKELLRQINLEHPGARERMFHRDPERQYQRMAGPDHPGAESAAQRQKKIFRNKTGRFFIIVLNDPFVTGDALF